jgi:hypothetical protein
VGRNAHPTEDGYAIYVTDMKTGSMEEL